MDGTAAGGHLTGLRISVITVCYDSAPTIGATLQSVATQRYENIEHLIVDGGSTDGTVDIVRNWRRHSVRLQSEPDDGIYDAMNKGLALATGEIVGFLHSDDLYANAQILARVVQAFDDPSIDAVYGDLVYVRKEDANAVVRYWKAGAFNRAHFASGWMPPHPTLFIRNSVYQRLGRFDTHYRIAADYDLILRFFARSTLQATYIPEVLVKMRIGGVSNRSLRMIVKKSFEDLHALRRNGFKGWWTLAQKNLSKVPQFFVRSTRG